MERGRSRDYLASADILRVAAMGLVVWYHIWQQSWLNPSFSLGDRYVDLFQLVRNGYMMVDVLLVLSGFLLALPYARAAQGLGPRPYARDFYLRRFWRIVPSYALAVLLVFFLWALPQGLYTSPGDALKDLLTHLTFTHNLSYPTYIGTPLPIVLWTMAVEVQFYLIFPLLVLFYEEQPGLTCLILTLLALCSRVWVYYQADTILWVNQLPCMLDLFACGMGAAWVYVKLSGRELSDGLRWALAAAALLALCVIFQTLFLQDPGDGGDHLRRGQLLWRLPLGLASAVFLVCGCLGPGKLSSILGNPLTRFLATISYNLYIWHQFLAVRLKALHIPPYAAELPNQAGEQPWQDRYTLLCFLAAIAAGALVTYLWEKPIYRKAAKRLR